MIKYNKTKAFSRDFKKLSKRFRSLSEDLDINKKYQIELFHLKSINSSGNNRGIVEIKGIGNTQELQFFKVKKFQCKSLKGRGAKSGIRIIYAFFPSKLEIVFLEIYFKSDQRKEDRQRIMDFKKIQEEK